MSVNQATYRSAPDVPATRCLPEWLLRVSDT